MFRREHVGLYRPVHFAVNVPSHVRMHVASFRCIEDSWSALCCLVGVESGGGRLTVVLDPHRWLELRRFRGLFGSGAMSLSEIARETGLDRKTVRKYLSAPGPATPPRRSRNGRSRARVIDEFAPLVDSMLRAEILMKAAVIHERLATEYGFTGNYQRVKLYVQESRPRIAEELGITPKELAGMHRRLE